MKVIKQLLLSGDDVEIADINIILELNACGRGFITAMTDNDYTGKLVRFDLGYHGAVLRWFMGYVEKSQAAENGSQRLFVREIVGIFERAWPCSMQHATLRKLTAWLAEKSNVKFIIPDGVDYADKPIPNFTHVGTGYQLLSNLGRTFSIEDYVWFQQPDGSVYVGSWADTIFTKKPIEIPPEFSQKASGGNAMTLPIIQSIRPGVFMNGQRISRVEINNDDLTLTWTPIDKATGQPQKSPAKRQLDSLYPELSAGLHLPRKARVMSPSESPTLGQQSDPFRPGYAVNLQLLDENGNPAADTPEYNGVPLPVPMAGAEGGMFQFPPEGTLVEVAFSDGRPDKPFVRQTLPEGNSLPNIKPGEQLQQQRAEVSQRVTVGGDWERKTDQKIDESSRARVVAADEETRTVIKRTTTIKATDTTLVVGTAKLLAGAIQQLAEGDYTIGTSAKLTASANQIDIVAADSIKVQAKPIEVTAQSITEKIAAVRRSVAGGAQEIIGSTVWLGSGGAARSSGINAMQSVLDILDILRDLAQLTAEHSHSNTGTPTNSGDIQNTATRAGTVKNRYDPLIAK
ncbi:hypothetical protein [Limnobaculum xujianqingii]|uniref:hypothetical protein n=1 Tax=Limnobaculum xujianqingii TaxID=2738837 RepID=UPI00112C5A11|nr:hypothetical protein [Limnobaculum xujianqingii]